MNNGNYSFDPALTTVSLDIKVPDSLWNVFRGNAQLLENGNILIDAPSSFDGSGGFRKPDTILPPTFYEIELSESIENDYKIVWQYQQTNLSGSFRCYNYSTTYVDSIVKQNCPNLK